MNGEILAAVVTAVVAVIGAFASFVVNKLKSAEQQKDINEIKNAIKSGGAYYVECPNCGRKIYLHNAEIKDEKEEK